MGEVNDQLVHQIIAEDFTNRYLKRTGMDRFAFAQPYDPESPLCDYSRTMWEADPKAWRGQRAANLILGMMHGLDGKGIDKLCVGPMAQDVYKIRGALQEYPLMFINGHSPALQAALSTYAADKALAHFAPKPFRQAYKEAVASTRVVATRAFAPILVGRPELPKKLQLPLLTIAGWDMNAHFSLPNNKRMRESALPRDFRSRYNDNFKADLYDAVRQEPRHPDGFHDLISMPAGGTDDVPGKHLLGHDIIVTAKVEDGTIDLIQSLGCAVVPIYTVFGRKKGPTIMKMGNIVPPDEVRRDTVPGMMVDLAEFRRQNGGGLVYYAEESIVAAA